MTIANCEHGHPCRCYERKLRQEQRDALDKAWLRSEQHEIEKRRTRRHLKIHANAIDPNKVCICRGS
jgi:hypothetical protein